MENTADMMTLGDFHTAQLEILEKARRLGLHPEGFTHKPTSDGAWTLTLSLGDGFAVITTVGEDLGVASLRMLRELDR